MKILYWAIADLPKRSRVRLGDGYCRENRVGLRRLILNCGLSPIQFRKFCLCLFLLACAGFSQAYTSNTGPFKISSFRVDYTQGMLIALSPAPPGCNGGDRFRMHLLVDRDSPYFKEMVSGLLAAYTSGNTLAYIWFSDEGTCSDSHILKLETYEMTPK